MIIVGPKNLGVVKSALIHHMQVITKNREGRLRGLTTYDDLKLDSLENEIKTTREILDAVNINLHRCVSDE